MPRTVTSVTHAGAYMRRSRPFKGSHAFSIRGKAPWRDTQEDGSQAGPARVEPVASRPSLSLHAIP
jgi:hypothetical protein